MGLGVKEDTKLPHVPGTVLLNDEAAHTDIALGLKHGTGKNAHIVLAPQPSEDPNDPLNWVRWRKEVHAVILLYGSMLYAATNGPLLNASLFVIATELNTTITACAVLGGYNLLAAGCAGPFVCAFSRKWGKRPVFLVSALFMVVGNAIGEAADTYSMLLAARIVQGFATSAYESLIVAAVGDVFYVHERGVRVSAITFILNASSSLASIICGQITAGLGWNWLFHFLQIFTIIQIVLMFFFCPESAYIRDHAYDIDQVTDDKLEQLAETEHKRAGITSEGEGEAVVEHTTSTRVIPPKKTFTQNLAIYTGSYSKESVIKQLIGPFVTLLNVGAAWSTVTSGLLTMWYVTSAIIQAGLFSGPPWDFTAAQVGYLSAGPFLGGLIGSAIMVFTSDPMAKWLTKRNKGIYEPEFRLWHMIGAVIGCGVGMFGYGHFIQIGGNAYVVAVFQGIMMVGVLIGTIAPVSYALDAYRDASNEIFIMNMLMKNFLFYGISYVANDWVVDDGAFDVLAVCASTSMFICLLAIPVYIYGKKLRSYWSRHNLLQKWGLQSSVQMEMGG